MKVKLDELIEKEKHSKLDQDYYQFMFNELESANLLEDEQIHLEEELQLLTHAEEIKIGLYTVAQVMSYAEPKLVRQIE